MVNVQIIPPTRERGNRVYRAVLTFAEGQVLGLQASISEALAARLKAAAENGERWIREHVHVRDAAGACLCEYDGDVAAGAFASLCHDLASVDAPPPYAELAWSFDDFAGYEDRLPAELAASWISAWDVNPPISDAAGAASPKATLPIRVKPSTIDLMHRYAVVGGYV